MTTVGPPAFLLIQLKNDPHLTFPVQQSQPSEGGVQPEVTQEGGTPSAPQHPPPRTLGTPPPPQGFSVHPCDGPRCLDGCRTTKGQLGDTLMRTSVSTLQLRPWAATSAGPHCFRSRMLTQSGPVPVPSQGTSETENKTISHRSIKENTKGLPGQSSRLGAHGVSMTTRLCSPKAGAPRAPRHPGPRSVIPPARGSAALLHHHGPSHMILSHGAHRPGPPTAPGSLPPPALGAIWPRPLPRPPA